ncbi:MAG TPA: extracellular solute-binding protein [Acidimicrobiales bacterium]|jgi:putative spermidine/putrescine transport system substrate-binding protein|nr:extracellular solute-binding protein [Acidimicrobiales bacterium]
MAPRSITRVLLAGATLASVAAIGVTAETGAASGAASVNWGKVTHLTKTGATSMSSLVKAAKKEGHLNVVALPDNWANYGNIIKGFSKKYGIKINSENPEGSSAEEIQAIQSDKGRSSDPDVIDVGTSYAVTAKSEGLLAPYKVSTWSEIPAGLKNPSGYWFDDYGGYVAIGCNTTTVTNCPTSFKQMSTETGAQGYKIGLNNSPLTSNSALAGVQAAAIASGGSLNNVAAGVSFFATLNKNGAFVNTIADASTAQDGTTNVIIWWDYLMANGGIDVPGWKVVIPSDVLLGEYYTQGINAGSPDPAAARLWEEYLYSTTGQNLWLAGGARPAELAFMTAHKTVNQTTLAKLPALPSGETPQYPSTAQITAAATTVNSTWATEVGASS